MAYRGADPTDVMGRRIGAYLIDGVIALLVVGGAAAVVFLGALQTAQTGSVVCPDDSGNRPPGSAAFCLEEDDEVRYLDDQQADELTGQFWLLSVAFSVVVNVALQGLTGATPGKFLVGLRVVRADGHNAGVLRCLVRSVLLVVDSACCAIVGLLTAFKSRGHRRVGDMVAGTMVVGRKDRDALIIARSGRQLPDRATLAAAAWSDTAGGPVTWAPPTGAPAPAATATPASGPVSFEPEPQPAPTPETAVATEAVAGLDAPTWDGERGAYIQYDPELAAWMQWSDEAGAWRPI